MLPGKTPRGEKESCDNCLKHPCYFHLTAGVDTMIFCDNYEYLDFHINFCGEDVKILENKGLKHA